MTKQQRKNVIRIGREDTVHAIVRNHSSPKAVKDSSPVQKPSHTKRDQQLHDRNGERTVGPKMSVQVAADEPFGKHSMSTRLCIM